MSAPTKQKRTRDQVKPHIVVTRRPGNYQKKPGLVRNFRRRSSPCSESLHCLRHLAKDSDFDDRAQHVMYPFVRWEVFRRIGRGERLCHILQVLQESWRVDHAHIRQVFGEVVQVLRDHSGVPPHLLVVKDMSLQGSFLNVGNATKDPKVEMGSIIDEDDTDDDGRSTDSGELETALRVVPTHKWRRKALAVVSEDGPDEELCSAVWNADQCQSRSIMYQDVTKQDVCGARHWEVPQMGERVRFAEDMHVLFYDLGADTSLVVREVRVSAKEFDGESGHKCIATCAIDEPTLLDRCKEIEDLLTRPRASVCWSPSWLSVCV